MKKSIILLFILLIFTGCSIPQKLDKPNNIPTTTVPTIPDEAYKIKDLRENQVSLVGKYEALDNPKVTFEIKKDYALLYYTVEEYTGYNNDDQNAQIISRVLEIEKNNNYNYLVQFYSNNNDEFILEVFSGGYDENLIKYTFKKQDYNINIFFIK